MDRTRLYILISIAVIFIIIYYFSDLIRQKAISILGMDDDDKTDCPDLKSDLKVKKRRKKYEYSTLNDVKMTDKVPEIKTLGYKDLLDLYRDDKFVQKFRDSISSSAESKIERYSKIRREISKSSVKSDDDKIGSYHLTRDFLSMIDRVIKMARSLKSISLDNVKSRLNMVIHGENGLDSLVGREDMKDFISTMIISFASNPDVFSSQFNNMIVMGPSGCGKTKLAMIIGESLSICGILIRNKFSYITKGDVTTAYVNESGKLMRKALIESLESVIFIDEAYDLSSSKFNKDHSDEAITEIINFLDKYIGLNIVILAGYEDRIKRDLMTMNEGLDRRFPHKFVLTNYSAEDLTSILVGQLESRNMTIDKDIHVMIYSLIKRIDVMGMFDKQAGDILNICGNISSSFYSSSWDRISDCLDRDSVIDGINRYLESKQSTIFIDRDQ